MICITGDMHHEFSRFTRANFPRQTQMTKDDYVIICGDFGGVLDGSIPEQELLDALNSLPFTLLFLDGDHENFSLLESYPVSEWHGGKVQFIRSSVIHLMRGQVYQLDGKSFFTMGGALSLYMEYLIENEGWWQHELPLPEEYGQAIFNLQKAQFQVDYILTHTCPDTVLTQLYGDAAQSDELTIFLDQVRKMTTFRRWFYGHHHQDRTDGAFTQLYKNFYFLEEESGQNSC